jgi:hypothetical protein
LPITASDSITLAVEHTRQQLFRPFRIGQWTKLAFVGLLAGELGGSGLNRSNFHVPSHTGATPHFGSPVFSGIDTGLLIAFIVSAVIAAFGIGIILMYVGSMMRFILFDSILARECHIRWSWNRRLGAGWRYFVWKLVYALLTLVAIGMLVGIPLVFAFAAGWLTQPKEHLVPLVLGGVVVLLGVLILLVCTAVIFVLTKDFVVPQMALENIGAMEGWRRLWPMMKAEKEAYVGYIGMKIVLAIAVGIVIAIATVILGLIFAVPTVALGILAVLTGKAAGLTWTASTIVLAVVIGCVLLAGFLYLVSLISVPVIVFFPAYSMYFFAGRYTRLSAALYAAPAAPQISPGAAPAPI